MGVVDQVVEIALLDPPVPAQVLIRQPAPFIEGDELDQILFMTRQHPTGNDPALAQLLPSALHWGGDPYLHADLETGLYRLRGDLGFALTLQPVDLQALFGGVLAYALDNAIGRLCVRRLAATHQTACCRI